MPISPPKPREPRTGRKTETPATAARATRAQQRYENVNGFFQLAAVGAVMRGWHADAGALEIHGPPISTEIVTLAEANDSIGKIVDYLGTVGPYTGLVMAVAKLAMQLAVNHNRLPATAGGASMGIVSPDALEAKVKADIARFEAQLMQEVLEAQKDAAEASARIQAFQGNGVREGEAVAGT
jgi:hypothetical protein